MALSEQFNNLYVQHEDPKVKEASKIIQSRADAEKPEDRVLRGSELRQVYRAANIRLWPGNGWVNRNPVESDYDEDDNVGGVGRNMTLHTTQADLHAPTVRKYMVQGIPERKGRSYEDGWDDVDKQLPEVMGTGKSTWIAEGHHRFVASRLRGEIGTDAMFTDLKNPRDDDDDDYY